MDLHDEYGLTRVINAWGVATRYGVSRSPEPVIEAAAEALRSYIDMAELSRVAGARIAAATGAEWATLTHCTAASVTLAVAACMTGADPERIKRLPDTRGMKNRVVIQAGHRVNYGHSIVQGIGLAGAEVLRAGSDGRCQPDQLAAALAEPDVAALVAVESHLCRGEMVATDAAVELARAAGVPVIVDGAAQDMRVAEILATGADLVLLSCQKYLSGLTAGLVLGRRALVDAVAMQQMGIGRAMKPSKEAIVGAMAAIEHRAGLALPAVAAGERAKAEAFAARLASLGRARVELIPDPTGNPIVRLRLHIDASAGGRNARQVADALASGNPVIATGAHYADRGYLHLELLGLDDAELDALFAGIDDALGSA